MHNISNNLPPDSGRRSSLNPQIANLNGAPKQAVSKTPPIFNLYGDDSLEITPQTGMVAGLPAPRLDDPQSKITDSTPETDSTATTFLEEENPELFIEPEPTSSEGFGSQFTEFFRRLGISFNFSSIFGSGDKTEYYASQNDVEVQSSGGDK